MIMEKIKAHMPDLSDRHWVHVYSGYAMLLGYATKHETV